MKHSNINRLYKYYGYNKRSISVLRNRIFWFAKPDSLNDPFDCKIPFDCSITVESVRKFLPRYARYRGLSKKQAERHLHQITNGNGQINRGFVKVWKGVLRKASENLKNSGVFCLSERCDNILMWSHYAKNHTGFCIEFERNPDNDLGDYDKTRKVKYGAEYPIINPLDPKAYDYKFFRKAVDWKYEKEWRLLSTQGNIAVPLLARISAVIFGLKMTAQHESVIRKVLPNVQYRKCTKASNQFGLRIMDV